MESQCCQYGESPCCYFVNDLDDPDILNLHVDGPVLETHPWHVELEPVP
jgi:hypothetical protein